MSIVDLSVLKNRIETFSSCIKSMQSGQGNTRKFFFHDAQHDGNVAVIVTLWSRLFLCKITVVATPALEAEKFLQVLQ